MTLSGGNVPKHAAPTSHRLRWIAIAAAALLAAGGVTWKIIDSTTKGSSRAAATTSAGSETACSKPTPLVVVAADGIAPVVQAAAPDACVELTLTTDSTAAAGAAVLDGTADVWIPDSRVRLLPFGLDSTNLAPSVAVSPVVLRAPDAVAAQLTANGPASWSVLLAQDSPIPVQIQDPLTSSTSLLLADALSGLATQATGDEYVGLAATAGALTGVPVADPAAPGDAIQVGEARLFTAADGMSVLPMAEGLPQLDYPMVNAPQIAGTTEELAAARLLAVLTGAEMDEERQAAGLLPAASAEFDVGDKGVELLAVPYGNDLPVLYALADAGANRGNTLAVLDVSGSMADPASPGGPIPMDVVKSSASLALQFLADDTSLGLWEFGYRLAGSSDHTELAPIAPLGSNRVALQAAIASAAPKQTGTSLYQTVLDSYLAVQQAWLPDHANQVVLFTDGRNEDAPGTIDLATLTTQLQAAMDPARPITMIFFGYGAADIPAMQAIAEITGGAVYQISAAEQMIGAFIDAIADSVLASIEQ